MKTKPTKPNKPKRTLAEATNHAYNRGFKLGMTAALKFLRCGATMPEMARLAKTLDASTDDTKPTLARLGLILCRAREEDRQRQQDRRNHNAPTA